MEDDADTAGDNNFHCRIEGLESVLDFSGQHLRLVAPGSAWLCT